MSLNGEIVRCFQSARRLRERCGRIADITRYLFVSDFRSAHIFPEATLLGKASPGRPFGF